MAARFALLLDDGPFGRCRPLAAHRTCEACGGHHVDAVDDTTVSDFPFRAAERVAPTASDTAITPSLRCRDCGHAWATATAAP